MPEYRGLTAQTVMPAASAPEINVLGVDTTLPGLRGLGLAAVGSAFYVVRYLLIVGGNALWRAKRAFGGVFDGSAWKSI